MRTGFILLGAAIFAAPALAQTAAPLAPDATCAEYTTLDAEAQMAALNLLKPQAGDKTGGPETATEESAPKVLAACNANASMTLQDAVAEAEKM